jgi:hypothetical protein
MPGIAATSEIVKVLGAISSSYFSGIINSIVPKSSPFVLSAAPPGTSTLFSDPSSANI